LAAAVNVFGGRYEPEGYGVPPIDIRSFSHKGTVFLLACSVIFEYLIMPIFFRNGNNGNKRKNGKYSPFPYSL
jgi:hypothetical protein